MQKVLAMLFALLLLISMAGCKGKDSDSPPGKPNREETTNMAASISETPHADGEAGTEDFINANAVYMCQFVKDCQAEPDSFQIHGVSHIEENGHHFYYLDYTHEVKDKEMERAHYFAEFDGSTLLCIVEENSSIYYQTEGDYTRKYGVLSALFREKSSGMLDAERIFSDLE